MGIRYTGQEDVNELSGCINDACLMAQFLVGMVQIQIGPSESVLAPYLVYFRLWRLLAEKYCGSF